MAPTYFGSSEWMFPKSHADSAGDQIELARLRSHERHMTHIYSLRWGGLALSAFTIGIGALMVFKGLQGSFNWAFQAPASIGAKLTNASPGIVFATIGLIIGFVVVSRRPVNYETTDEGDSLLGEYRPRRRRRRGISLGE